jgi:hypothetical protein
MATRMQQRRGTAAQWDAANPILAAGEIGFVTDTGQFKIGDGVNNWSSLGIFKDFGDLDGNGFVLDSEKGQPNGVATLTANGNIPISQLGALIDGAPETLNTLKEIGDFVNTVDNAVSNHGILTENVHGITNTANIVYTDDLTDALAQNVTDRNAALTAQATSLNTAIETAETSANSYTDGKIADEVTNRNNAIAESVSDHNDATTNVHGIGDTSLLATKAYAELKASDAQTAAISAAGSAADTKVSDHNSDTTNVHGITDSANLVYTGDSRLSDTRTPSDGSVTDAKIDANGLSQSSIVNLTTDLAAKAALVSPALTGTPTAPTAAAGTNTTQIATTEFVGTAVANLVASAPAALNTLDELAAALGDDANFASTVTTALASKASTADLNAAMLVSFNNKTSSYTLALTDSTNLVEMDSSSSTTVTVPTNATVAFPVGSSVDIFQKGTGQVTIAAAAGVTVYYTPGLKLRAQYSAATLVKRSTDTWILTGDLTA